jgi:phage tail sheath protein FI
MVDFLSPGTKVVQRRKGPVVLPGIATAIGGFLVYTEKGAIGTPVLVTGPDDAAEVFGGRITSPGNGRMTDALQDYFGQGGASCYVMRYCGAGYASGARTSTCTGAATAGALTSTAASFPAVLAAGDTFLGKVDGGGAVTATVTAVAASKTGAAATYGAGAGGDTMVVSITGVLGGANQTIDTSAAVGTEAGYLASINSQLIGGSVVDSGGQLKIQTDQKGSGAAGSVVSYGGAAAAKIGIATGAFTAGTGNVANVAAVTAAELAAILTAAPYTGSTIVANANNSITWTSGTTGASSSVQFSSGTGVSKITGLDNAVHSGAASGASNTATFTASSPGAWANSVGIKVTKVDTTVTTATATSAGSTSSLVITSTARLRIGDTISITKVADVQRGVISAINGTTVTLSAAITVPGGGYSTAQSVVLETFDVYVYDSEGLVYAPSPFRNLRMSPLAGLNYFVNAINSASRSPITVANLSSVAADPRPATDTAAVLMTGGLNGAAPVAADVTSQIANWDKADDVSFISTPGGNTDFTGANGVAILVAQESYATLRGDIIAIVDLPSGTAATGGGGVKDYIQNTANLASSYEAAYWPWCERLDSPTGTLVMFPPSPFVQGIISRTHATRNFGKAPAGIVDGQVLGITGLQTVLKENSAEYDDFYPAGVNAILKFPGQGYAVWGSKTLDPTGEFGQINVQIVFNVNKRLVKTKTRFINFENNDTDTRASVVRVLTATFREQRKSKILQGASDDEAFYVICDESNNTPLVIASGKLKCRIGLAVSRASEFVEYTFEQDTRAIDAALAAVQG